MRKKRDWRRRLRGMFKAKGHVDTVAGNRITGWAFADGASVRVEASVGNNVVASTVPDLPRPDIVAAFPGWTRALRSGFTLDLPQVAVPDGQVRDVGITVRPLSPFHLRRKLTTVALAGPQTIARLANPPASGIVGAFPKRIVDAVAALWPEVCRDLHGAAGQAAFLAKFRTILSTPSLRSNHAIVEYVRYVQATWAHFNFVDRFFPAVNANATEGSTDFNCKPNSVYEMIAVAHQLYVLASYGIPGDFAEFGCFKGFSSAMLSFACRELSLTMHVFDSFEGLPSAEGSGYRAGEYAGSLDEVRTNVARFGSIETVEFHKGFFSDTFRTYRPPPLMCLWMDVDLESSSRDLMVVADLLDPRATLFSHECVPAMFKDGDIVDAPRLDNPIPPVLDRFAGLGRPLTGRFIRGNTGAFWPRDGGIPALDHAVLVELLQTISRT